MEEDGTKHTILKMVESSRLPSSAKVDHENEDDRGVTFCYTLSGKQYKALITMLMKKMKGC